MKRTISAMVGQGSVNHNSRKFHAKNTDPERSHLNITYCQENIKAVSMNSLTRLWSATTLNRPGPTEGLRITMRKSARASRKSRSTKSFCKWAIETI